MGKTKFQASRRRGKESLNDLRLNFCKAYFNFCQTKLAVTQGVGTIGSHDIAPKYTSAMLSMSMQNKFQNDDEKSIIRKKFRIQKSLIKKTLMNPFYGWGSTASRL